MDIESLQKFCLSLPAVTEDIKWEHDLVFSVGGKMFCAAGLEPPFACSLKVNDEEFGELTGKQGIQPAPYLARAKWVLVNNDAGWTKKDWEDYIRNSYELIKSKLSKKLKQELNLE